MKKILCVLLIICPAIAFTQDSKPEKNIKQAYFVHEDQVMPRMVETYESLNQELVEACKTHHHQGTMWLTATMNNYRYLYLTPFDKFAELDDNVWSGLAEKIGEEKFMGIFNRMDKCYDKHGSYVIYLNHEYSYMPDGVTQTPKGENYRKYMYWHFTPDNYDAFMKVAKDFQELYVKKNSKMQFRFYSSGMGVMGNFAMIAIAAPDEITFINRSIENRKLLGEEGKMLMLKARSLSYKFEEMNGNVRMDMSYFPEKPESADRNK